MKRVVMVLALLLASACSADQKPPTEPANPTEVTQPAESKKTCIYVWDANLKKEVQKCRVLKIHQQYKGTQVPREK